MTADRQTNACRVGWSEAKLATAYIFVCRGCVWGGGMRTDVRAGAEAGAAGAGSGRSCALGEETGEKKRWVATKKRARETKISSTSPRHATQMGGRDTLFGWDLRDQFHLSGLVSLHMPHTLVLPAAPRPTSFYFISFIFLWGCIAAVSCCVSFHIRSALCRVE